MKLIFLVPLTTAIISGYLFQNTAQEIAYLTGAITGLSLILTLILAPWQIQLLIVILAIIIVRPFWQQLKAIEEPQEIALTEDVDVTTDNLTQEPKNSIYRGVSSPLSVTTSEVNTEKTPGKYRGTPTKVNQPLQPIVSNSKNKIKYRGASFSTPESDDDELVPL